mmetsp:Transcript_2747/g.4701  ORF Transcript_2747/g.4701 Transcript_2747/m.4701 type:complete len:282 (-) Transcript_2747:17-862(-)
MKAKLVDREEFFNKEIQLFKKEQANLEKKLDKLENPPEAQKAQQAVTQTSTKEGTAAPTKGRKLTKKQQEAEQAALKAKQEEEERLRKEEELRKKKEEEEAERKRKEEEEAAKKKGGKGDKGKKGKVEEEVVEEVVEETEEQRVEREKKELKEKIDSLKVKTEQYQGKVKLCLEEREKQDKEEQRQKTTDLVEKTSQERKFLKAGSREFANTVLAERRAYLFVELKKNPEDEAAEEEPHMIKINGAAIRTPDQDIKWEEEQKELEAAAPKGGKAPPKGKKK